jgi:hypothetical protein
MVVQSSCFKYGVKRVKTSWMSWRSAGIGTREELERLEREAEEDWRFEYQGEDSEPS